MRLLSARRVINDAAAGVAPAVPVATEIPQGAGPSRIRELLLAPPQPAPMAALSFDETGVDVVYEGTEFRLEKRLIEEAIGKAYPDVTDHEVLQIVEPEPSLSGEPRRVADILG